MTARDGRRVRTAFFPVADAAGHVLLLNGRTEFIEKYLETIASLRERGLAVWTLDWRGQGRSERLLDDAERGHAGSFDDFVDDLDRYLTTSVLPGAAGAPLMLLAHSMGGNIGLRFLHGHQHHFQRAVFSAPMVAFHVGKLPRPLARLLAGAMCATGRAGAYAMGQGPAASHPVFDDNPLTSCPERFARLQRLLEDDPESRLGGVTWGWLSAALRSTALTDAPGFARQLRIPLLVFVAQQERIVDNAAIGRFVGALPAGRLVEIPGARHELLCERDEPRSMVWREIDRFLDVRARPPDAVLGMA
ncbi:alpha/beta fold hydrolase [Verticiella sediminum]|uniref:alpha/beta fold hydrolase n=1 Tax=Verticiella sediminum TaxID=1247510 RepID=UPI001478B417|nr:alpha/beta hydrolase [Verticiella sediminum]